MADESTVGLGDALQMATRNGEGFGGTDGWLWIVVLFLLIGGGNYFGNNKQPQPVTDSGLCNAMNFNDLQNQVGRMNDLMQTQFMQTSQGLASVGYENLRNFSQTQDAINANMTAQTQKVLDAIAQNKIDTLQARVNQLEMQNAMCGVVRYPNATTYTAGPGPYCGSQCF